jgi:16S rRNA (guanine966-N2)-methyltransferase
MTDRVRENLFNLLAACVPDAVVLDLFAGSGALGLEALSRGAAWCTFVERDPAAARTLETNCALLGFKERARIERRDALWPGDWVRPPEGSRYTLLFADPPYRLSADPAGSDGLARMAADLGRMGCIAPGAVAMLRMERGTAAPQPWPGFEADDERTYGTTTLHLMAYGAGAPG